MRKILSVILLISAMLSCKQEQKEPVRLTGEAQGTYYSITYYDGKMRNYGDQIDSLFKAFDLSASVYLKSSIISRFNNNDTTVTADKIFTTVYEKSMEVSEKTDGAFDITVMPLVNAWGFGFSKKQTIRPSLIDSLKLLVGYKKVRLEDGKLIKQDSSMMLDFNAIAQGYTSDIIGDFFESKGITNYLVDVGGEVLANGSKPDGKEWTVGIETPAADSLAAREVEGTVKLKNKALATSGNYRKYYIEGGQRYSHTIDPNTGYPVKHSVLSVSVLANDCITADAYATAFMVMGLEQTKEFIKNEPNLDVLIIYDENGELKTWASKGFEFEQL